MLNELLTNMEAAEDRYNKINDKIDIYVETVLNQYEINCKKSLLKVVQESGTEDDYAYLEAEASNGVIESLKNAIDKIIEALKKFFNELKIKVVSLVMRKESKDTLDDIHKKVRFNPFISKKKIAVPDTEKKMKIFDWAEGEYAKLIAKIKGGKNVEKDEIEKVKTGLDKKMVAIAAGTVVTVGVAVALAIKNRDKLQAKLQDAQKKGEDLIGSVKNLGEMFAPAKQAITNIASDLSKLAQARGKAIVEGFSGLMSSIKGGVAKLKGGVQDNGATDTEVKQESVEYSIMDQINADLNDETAPHMESTSYETDADDLLDDLFSEF